MAVNRTLHHPSKHKKELLEEEELFIASYSLFDESMIDSLNKGWVKEEKGYSPSYTGGNVHIYLMYRALIARNKVQLEKSCVPPEFKCLEERLACLSRELGYDYVNLWKRLKELFGIDNIDCSVSCCEGISKMVINGDDCNGFIIGECDLVITDNILPRGPFRFGGFKLKGIKEITGNIELLK